MTPPLPKFLRPSPAAAGGNGNGANGANGGPRHGAHAQGPGASRARPASVGWLDERSGAQPLPARLPIPQGPEGDQLVLHARLGHDVRLPLAGRDGRLPGDVLRAGLRPRAYESASHITNDVFLGELVRGMHKWGSTVMIVLIFLHMGRTFFFGAYKYPRELNWVIGVVLLVLTLMMGLTGYLLPFDQRSFWATVVAVNLNSSGPIVGPYLADFLRAGAEFGPTTMSRFYALHMLAVPGPDRGADRRAPVPGGQARHHRATVGQGREEGPPLRGDLTWTPVRRRSTSASTRS